MNNAFLQGARTLSCALLLVLLCCDISVGQIRRRIILTPKYESADSEPVLEVLEIEVAGRPVEPNQPFEAYENWLWDLKVRVRNISGGPVVFLHLNGSLLEGIDQEFKPGESVRHAISMTYGKTFDPEKRSAGRAVKAILEPDQEVVLTFENVSQLYRKILNEVGAGTFCQMRLSAGVQLKDGTFKSGYVVPRPEKN